MKLRQILSEKWKEALQAVLPIITIVLALSFTIAPLSPSVLLCFLMGAVLILVGMMFFTTGAETAMTPMGERIGTAMTKTKKLGVVITLSFLLGFIITVSEPDLQVLASQVPSVPNLILILSVACGVGVFLVVSLLRMLFSIALPPLLVGCYAVVFLLAFFVPPEFLAVAFDSGGVTTGPITVPFIMALGLGLTAVRGDKNAESDSFGLVALCSIGPILSVLILGMIYNPEGAGYTPLSIPDIASTRELWLEFGHALPDYAKEVLLALAPILAFFVVFQVFFLKLRRKALVKILVGMLYTLVGLTLFLTGVNVGFMPAGNYIGKQLAELPYNWVLVPLGMLIGYYIVKAEPAVLVLNKQVEEITGGAISQKVMMAGLSIGMSVSLGLSMVRVLTGVSLLWFLVPGYALALGLSFLVPKIFTAIAFDSGGVASGPMTATFLLPFAMGACEAVGGNILTDAFGIVAMVAMTPLITIQIIGLVYQFKTRRAPAAAEVHAVQDEEIIEFGVSAGEDAT